jgi:LmbE family N-acetylglucosaminyl deacetylase
MEDKLPGKKVLVLAPHQDDEVIGCGGTIYKHVKAGGTCDILYFTHDSEKREEESITALTTLGINSSTNLKYKIETLAAQAKLQEELLNILKEKKPDIVFLPFLLDNHVDHRAVNQALINIGAENSFECMVYAYPVWFPVYPNILVDISDVWQNKKEAILAYKSQMADRDYVKMSYSLGQYWAMVKGRNIEVVETFFKATLKEYSKLGKKVFK